MPSGPHHAVAPLSRPLPAFLLCPLPSPSPVGRGPSAVPSLPRSHAGVSCLTSLVKLQASFNRFTALPEGLLRLPHLEMMRVAVCDIRSLPPGLQAGSASGVLPKLAWCSVAGNPCCPEAPAAAPGLPTVAREELELGQKLGDGASGEVFRGEQDGWRQWFPHGGGGAAMVHGACGAASC